jgi:hypothetical protein
MNSEPASAASMSRPGALVSRCVSPATTALLRGRMGDLFSADVEPRIGFKLATGAYMLLAAWHVAPWIRH